MTSSLPVSLQAAIRRLVKTPNHTLVTVLALLLGISLPTIMYGIVYGVFLRPLPFPEAEKIVRVEYVDAKGPNLSPKIPFRDFLHFRDHQKSFEELVAWLAVSGNVSGGDISPASHDVAYVSAGIFELVRAKPLLGRTFSRVEEQPGGESLALISAEMWRERFHEDPQVVGRTFRLYGSPVTILGVMPYGFEFPYSQDLWLPMGAWPAGTVYERNLPVFVIGRLAQGVTTRAAQAEIQGLAEQTTALRKGELEVRVEVSPYVEGYSDAQSRKAHILMLLVISGIFLIACANVATLLLSRSITGRREHAIRLALGAARMQALMPELVEVALVTLLGGGLGILTAAWGLRTYDRIMGDRFGAFWADIRLEPSVLLFAIGLMVVAAALSALVPSLQALRSRAITDLGLGQRSFDGPAVEGWGRFLVVGQITLCCGLLMATGWMIQSLLHLSDMSRNIPTENLLTAQLSLSSEDLPDEESWRRTWARLLQNVESLPEVETVGLISSLPGTRIREGVFRIPGRREDRSARWVSATPTAFDLLDLQPLTGRLLLSTDTANSAPVAVVTLSFARRHFGSASPVDRFLNLWPDTEKEMKIRIVGMVPDIALGELGSNDRDVLFLALDQVAQDDLRFLIRTSDSSGVFRSQLRKTVAGVVAEQPLYEVATMGTMLADAARIHRWAAIVFTLFAGAALFLTCLGLYGVINFQVYRRRPEFGLRMALGARRPDIFRLVTTSALRLTVLGVLLGSVAGVWASRLLSGLLYRVEPGSSWLPYVAMAVLLATVALSAGLLPAARATHWDPNRLLRED